MDVANGDFTILLLPGTLNRIGMPKVIGWRMWQKSLRTPSYYRQRLVSTPITTERHTVGPITLVLSLIPIPTLDSLCWPPGH